MDVLQVAIDWILGLLINLLVPAMVWATVIAGLILIVRDKVDESNVSEPFSHPDKGCLGTCCESGNRNPGIELIKERC